MREAERLGVSRAAVWRRLDGTVRHPWKLYKVEYVRQKRYQKKTQAGRGTA